MSLGNDAPEIGRDSLDPPGPSPVWAQLFPARRAALGLRPSAAPSLVFVVVGIVLGPTGLGLLNGTLLQHLDPVVSVALAALGVFVGLGIGAMGGRGNLRLAGAALFQAMVTVVIVAAGVYALVAQWGLPLPVNASLFAVGIGICACSSAATRPAAGDASRLAARVVDLDDVPLILLGTIAVVIAAGGELGRAIGLTVVAAAVTSAAGWLLFERARTEAERGVFVTGTVLMLGGISAYAGTSPLLGGLLAALFWHQASGDADRIIGSDLAKLQHPLVAMLLIVAGASIQWQVALAWIAAPLVLLRLVGKLAGSLAASALIGVPAGLLAAVLVPPGVLGIALALNLQQVLGGTGALLLSGVVVASVVSELLSVWVPAHVERAS